MEELQHTYTHTHTHESKELFCHFFNPFECDSKNKPFAMSWCFKTGKQAL